MKMKPETVEKLAALMRAYLDAPQNHKLRDACRRLLADRQLPDSSHWTLWFAVHGDITAEDGHPRFVGNPRVNAFDRTFPLYHDGCNDDSMTTALRVIVAKAASLIQ